MGDPLLLAAVFPCQSDFQLSGGSQRVIKEHLIKIAQPIEQNAVLILGFRLHILFHHWC